MYQSFKYMVIYDHSQYCICCFNLFLLNDRLAPGVSLASLSLTTASLSLTTAVKHTVREIRHQDPTASIFHIYGCYELSSVILCNLCYLNLSSFVSSLRRYKAHRKRNKAPLSNTTQQCQSFKCRVH